MKSFCFHTYFLFVTSFGFATYFRVNLASNALHRKANSFTLTKSKFSRNLMEQSDFFLCHTDNVSRDSMFSFPLLSAALPSLHQVKGSADCLQSQTDQPQLSSALSLCECRLYSQLWPDLHDQELYSAQELSDPVQYFRNLSS